MEDCDLSNVQEKKINSTFKKFKWVLGLLIARYFNLYYGIVAT